MTTSRNSTTQAYRCLTCGCLHGWTRHPAVMPIKHHHRYPLEDVWWCPQCTREHRTTDGTMLGQLRKRWEIVVLTTDEQGYNCTPRKEYHNA